MGESKWSSEVPTIMALIAANKSVKEISEYYGLTHSAMETVLKRLRKKSLLSICVEREDLVRMH